MAKKNLNYVNGVNLATAKKIAVFTFGEKNVLKAKANLNTMDFVIYVSEKLMTEKPDLVEHFKQFWKFKLIGVKMTN